MPATVPTNDGIPHVHIRNSRQELTIQLILKIHIFAFPCLLSIFAIIALLDNFTYSQKISLSNTLFTDRAPLLTLYSGFRTTRSVWDANEVVTIDCWAPTIVYLRIYLNYSVGGCSSASGHDACTLRLGAVRQSRLWDGHWTICRGWVDGSANVHMMDWWTPLAVGIGNGSSVFCSHTMYGSSYFLF